MTHLRRPAIAAEARAERDDQCPSCFRFHVLGTACPYPTTWLIPENRIDRHMVGGPVIEATAVRERD